MNYLLCGTVSFALRQRRAQIVRETVGSEDSMSCSLYRGSEKTDIREILDDCRTVTLFGDGRLVIYENPRFLAALANQPQSDLIESEQRRPEADLLIEYLDNADPDCTLLLYCDYALPANSRIIKQLSSHLKFERHDQLQPADFQQEVRRDINKRGLRLDQRCQKRLFERLPLSLENWQREADKLEAYPGVIDEQIIDLLVNKPLEENTFALSNAVVDRRLADAILVLRDLMVNHHNDIPAFIGLLANQFRQMCQIRILSDQGAGMAEMAQCLGTKSSYRVQMVLKSINNATSQQLLGLLDRLSALDQSIKAGEIDAQTGLELFIVEACRRQ